MKISEKHILLSVFLVLLYALRQSDKICSKRRPGKRPIVTANPHFIK